MRVPRESTASNFVLAILNSNELIAHQNFPQGMRPLSPNYPCFPMTQMTRHQTSCSSKDHARV